MSVTPTAAHDGPRTPPSYPVRDSMTMIRRRVLHIRRYPSLTLLLVGMPVVFLLLFVYVFGATMGAGLAGPGGGRGAYLAFIAPAILVMTVAGVAQATAIGVATDMTGGIVARFRTMAIARVSVLTGHVVGALIQTGVALVPVLGVALLLGYRPAAGPLGWLGALGLLAATAFALTWLTVGLGLAARSVESSSNTPMILILLPFLGSGFVPAATLPVGLRWFAEYQPFSAVIDTLRDLLDGTAGGLVGHAALASGWCLALAAGGYLWSRHLYRVRADR